MSVRKVPYPMDLSCLRNRKIDMGIVFLCIVRKQSRGGNTIYHDKAPIEPLLSIIICITESETLFAV